MKKIAIFGSGNGSNFEAITNAIANNKIVNCELIFVYCDNETAFLIERANKLGVKSFTPGSFNLKKNDILLEKNLLSLLKKKNVDFIFLAGYKKILTKHFLEAFGKPIINIHPSLLPKYPGLNAIEKAVSNKDKYVGITTHYVSEILDKGPVIFQKKIKLTKLLRNDNNLLLKKINKKEHKLYIKTINYVIR